MRLKQDRPSWGAPKIRKSWPGLSTCTRRPSAPYTRFSIAMAWSAQNGAAEQGEGSALSLPGQPNDLWCADYKGEFMLADRRYCYPLTITDFASRYLFACEALSTTKEAYAFPVFKAVFKEFGFPRPSAKTTAFPSQAPMCSSG